MSRRSLQQKLVLLVSVMFLVGAVFPGLASAEKTQLKVMVKAKDALFIGGAMGGVRVVVRDAVTGRTLAEGVTSGPSGNPEIVMGQPHARNARLGEGAAAFTTILDLDEPTLVEIEAYGPLAQRQAAVRVSTQVWLVPGLDTPGDGVVLEMPGFVVDIASPKAHAMRKTPAKEELVAFVMPMCGCPVNEKTFWKPDSLDVTAVVQKGGREVQSVKLHYAGSTGKFSAPLLLDYPGIYKVWVYAFDPVSGNTGVDFTTFVVR